MSIIPISAFPSALRATAFLTGDVPNSCLQVDPRILYSAFIPDEHYPRAPDEPTKLPVLVAIHGTSRTNGRCIDAWRDFASQHRCAVIAPIFPCGFSGPLDIDGYHYLGRPPKPSTPIYEDILKQAIEVPNVFVKATDQPTRHDLHLLMLLQEVAIRWPSLDTSKILLTGFSGGGQYVHRFMYLYPERLLAANVGAPGSVTPLDFHKPWPAGLKDVEEIFGRHVDVSLLKDVPLLASVGAEDKFGSRAKARRYIKGEAFGTEAEVNKTRVQRLRDVVEQWKACGLKVEIVLVDDAMHEMEKVNAGVVPWMAKQVEQYWAKHG